MRFLSIEYQVEMCSPAERAHACGLWNLKSPYCYCLTCFRFCHTRVLFFSSVSYYFYDLICYHFLLKLCIVREFCLCSIFSWHNEWISFRMSFEESKIDSHGNQQQIRFHAKGRWTQKSQMKKYGFYLVLFMSVLLTHSIVKRISNGHSSFMNTNQSSTESMCLKTMKYLFASALRLVLCR